MKTLVIFIAMGANNDLGMVCNKVVTVNNDPVMINNTFLK